MKNGLNNKRTRKNEKKKKKGKGQENNHDREIKYRNIAELLRANQKAVGGEV